MRKSLFGVTVAALVLPMSQPLVAQDDVDQQLGNGGRTVLVEARLQAVQVDEAGDDSPGSA